MKFIFKLFLFVFILSLNTFAQFTQFHPELDWYTIKGKHAEVHFHEGTERTAEVILKIIDEVWGPITSLYEYEPETVHFVIKDLDDYSNGATYFFDNKIEIWASALDFDLRGTHNWLRNVISHEFTHLVQIQASMKATRTLPAVFLQMMNYEDERRPDILYGFPNFIVSYPFATINVPAWWAEGTAQYMRKELDYERWDSHRDMILRSYVLDNKMLTWNEMGVFGKTSLGNESVYNSGFSLTRYISQKYGEAKLREISKSLGKFTNFTIDAAFKDVLGKSGNEVYNEWKSYLTDYYKKRTQNIDTLKGNMISDVGFGNFYPTISKDKNKIYYISNKSSDYFSPSNLYVYDLNTKEEKKLIDNIRSTYGFIGNEKKIVYAKLSDDNKNYYNVHDLYVYDVTSEDEVRLTNNLRANQPTVSNDGKKIAFLFQKDGTTNLGIVDIDGNNFKQLTFYKNGEQIYNPKFSNDGNLILFDFSYLHNRDIAYYDLSKNVYDFLIATEDDERNPVLDKDGNLIYASDRTGIYNIYRRELKSNTDVQLTNVLGGAFMPAIDENNDIAYAGYTSSGYKIFYLPISEQKQIAKNSSYERPQNYPLGEDRPNGDISKFDVNTLKNFNDKEDIKSEPKKYAGAFSKLTFFPFVRYDNYNTSNKFIEKLKPGLYISSNDMLNRYSLFAGGSINTRLERDLFLTFDYRNKLPLLFDLGLKPELTLELYNISRKSNVDIFFGTDSTEGVDYTYKIPTDVTYNLFEVDLAARHRIFSRYSNLEFRYIFSRYSAAIGSFILPDENNTLYPTTDDTYLIGSNFQIKYDLDLWLPHKNDDINPLGMQVELRYNYEMNKFNDEGQYEIKDGTLQPKYNHFNFHRLELNSKFAAPLWYGHSLTAQLRAGTIFGPQMPDFFDFYLGGLIGMKAYPFYALSGNEIGWLNLTYRLPLFENIDTRIGHLYLDKIFFSVYGDLGHAWNGDIPAFKDFKKGVGAEIRIQMTSFYMFPTSVFVNASYGFDKFTRFVRDREVTYGKELRLYGGILFGFDF